MFLRKDKYIVFNSTPSISAHTLVLALLLQFFPDPGPQKPFFLPSSLNRIFVLFNRLKYLNARIAPLTKVARTISKEVFCRKNVIGQWTWSWDTIYLYCFPYFLVYNPLLDGSSPIWREPLKTALGSGHLLPWGDQWRITNVPEILMKMNTPFPTNSW